MPSPRNNRVPFANLRLNRGHLESDDAGATPKSNPLIKKCLSRRPLGKAVRAIHRPTTAAQDSPGKRQRSDEAHGHALGVPSVATVERVIAIREPAKSQQLVVAGEVV
jgi:hypothetical protein